MYQCNSPIGYRSIQCMLDDNVSITQEAFLAINIFTKNIRILALCITCKCLDIKVSSYLCIPCTCLDINVSKYLL